MEVKFDGDYDKLSPVQQNQVKILMKTSTNLYPEKANEIIQAYGRKMGLCSEVFVSAFSEYVIDYMVLK